jgi:hypothetical protein
MSSRDRFPAGRVCLRAGARVTAMLAVGALAAGCSAKAGPAAASAGGSGSAAHQPASTSSEKSLRSGELVPQPLDAYIADNTQSNAIDQATTELIDKCMRAKGFTVPPPTPAQQELAQLTSSSSLQEPYGLTSAYQAAEFGYSSPVAAKIKLPHPIRSFGPGTIGPKESPAYYTALTGYPSGVSPAGYDTVKGCTGRAYNALDGGPAPVDPHDVVGTLAGQAEQDTQGSSVVIQALAAWASCMAAKGYSYQTPMQAASAKWPQSPSPLEISTAKADVSCKAKSNLRLIWQRTQASYERKLINQYAGALAQVKRASAAEVRRAEAALARNGT